ncbi:MAG: hypothetical protein IJK04_03695 [Kiritimatiellae bacterium]|nr:hypothetical protein [Kiritimatiellia bacterium]
MKKVRLLSSLAAAILAATAAAAEENRPPFERDICTNLWLRLSAPGLKGAAVESHVCHTLHTERPLESTRIGDDGLSGWIRMPRYRAKKEIPTFWYQSCVFNFKDGGKYSERESEVALEIAASTNEPPFLALPPEHVVGGTVCALFEATRIAEPMRAEWFADHLEALDEAMAKAGCEELSLPADIHLNMHFGLSSRFDRSRITRDPRLYDVIGCIMRRLGCNSSMLGSPWSWDGLSSQGYRFVTGDREALYCPLDEDWRERCRALFGRARDSWLKAGRKMPELIKVGDEIGQIRDYTNSPAFRATFEDVRRRLAPELPEGLAITAINGRAAWTNRPPTRGERLERYLTVRARNLETAKVWREVTDTVRQVVCPASRTTANMIPWYDGEGGSWQQTLSATPDPFLLARVGSLDYPELQSLTPYALPTGPMANAMLAPAFVAQIRELNSRVGGRSRQMLFPCRCEAQSFDHVFMSALLNGNTDLTYYSLGFHATWGEWADTPEKLVALAKCTRRLGNAAPFLAGQRRAKADIAMLLSESTDIWQCEGDWRHYRRTSAKSEMRGDYYALRFSGYRVDFVREHMVEDGFLDGYKVIWATMRNLNRVCQAKVLDWVKAGGALVLVPGAITRDEADDETALFDAYRAEGEAAAL